jgi:hypothetical protein
MIAGMRRLWPVPAACLAMLPIVPVLAHAIGGKDAAFVAASQGFAFWPFFYLGAKHMVTGYDHLLFLLGVIFFLFRLRDVALYVTLFSLGHSLTLLAGVLLNIRADPYLVDAVIGFSVVWKAFDNLGGFLSLFGRQPDNRVVVAGFGLVHGFGLATKLQDLQLNPDGLVGNLIAFNLGVETGQLLALTAMLLLVLAWRRLPSFGRTAFLANGAIMTAGFLLVEYQLAGFFLGNET